MTLRQSAVETTVLRVILRHSAVAGKYMRMPLRHSAVGRDSAADDTSSLHNNGRGLRMSLRNSTVTDEGC